jgi:hypothetical protein
MTLLVASLECAARRTFTAIVGALAESASSFRNYEAGDYVELATPDDPSDEPAVVERVRLRVVRGVPTYASLVAILTEISHHHDELNIAENGDATAYCDCGQRLSTSTDPLGEHRAHVAELQASAIADAIQVARNTSARGV